MSARYDLHLKCDAQGCKEEKGYSSTGDAYAHAAERDGWRWTATGQCYCKKHAQHEWPGSFARVNGHEFPDQQKTPVDTGEGWLE